MKKLFIFLFSIFSLLYMNCAFATTTNEEILQLKRDIYDLKNKLESSEIKNTKKDFLNDTKFFGKLHFEFLHSDNKGNSSYLLGGDDGEKTFDNLRIKSLKFGVKQKLSSDTSFNFILKWSSNSLKFDCVYLDYKLSPKLTASLGQVFIPLSMENENSGNSYQLTDTTRYYNIGSFLFDNGLGLKIKYIDDNFGIFTGVYGNAYNDKIDKINKTMFSFKTYFNPYKNENNVVHIGANYLNSIASYSENRKIPNSENNNLEYDFKQVEHMNVDFALNFNWFNLQSEYTKSFLTPAAVNHKKKFDVSNYYIQTSFLLTGETIEYNEGAFGKVKVNNSVESGGLGAFETSFRFAITDLQDRKSNKIFDYGKYKEFSFAFSWIPTDFLKTTLQYSRVKEHFIDNLTILANNGKKNNDYDLISLKCKVFF